MARTIAKMAASMYGAGMSRRRKRAFALGLGFHPWTLALIQRAAVGWVRVGAGWDVRTLREAYAVIPRRSAMITIMPAHSEHVFVYVTPEYLLSPRCARRRRPRR